jgi:sulfotransferase famil protein
MVTSYLFAHIPKTAGTSFRKGLTKALGEDAVSPPLFPSRLSQADVNRLDHYRAIAGHISIDDAALFRKRYLLTIVRDPADRCLSWYYYAHNHSAPRQTPDWRAARECTVHDFFRLDREIIFRNIFNRQVRQLGGHVLDSEINLSVALSRAKTTLRDAAWVGRVETLPADLLRLRNRFPEFLDFELPKLNVTQNRQSLGALDPDIISQIRLLNAFDLDLYCFATEEMSSGSNLTFGTHGLRQQ